LKFFNPEIGCPIFRVGCEKWEFVWVAEPQLWQWSSFRAYALGEAGPVSVNDWQVLKMKVRR